jgi:hypothetical protein
MKCTCTERRCGWKGMDTDVLSSANPFIPEETIYACPLCREIGSVVYACDEPECWQPVTCGTPVNGGYRQTCGKHAPRSGT